MKEKAGRLVYDLKRASDIYKEEKSLEKLDYMLSLKSKYQTQDEKNEPQPLQNYSAVPLKPKSD